KVLWSTVLIDTLVPVFFENAFSTAAVAAFGTGSDAFEPNVTVPASAATSDVGTAPRALAAVSPETVARPAAPEKSSDRRLRSGSSERESGSVMKTSSGLGS